MLDIGWPEVLVVAIILIVFVGPKDLPQMLRAFGKMTTRLRKTAGEFRSQFDEALREAELDDVRQTISDARKLNPMNTVREALNPLRDAGREIKSDLQKAVAPEPVKAEAEKVVETEMKVSEPAMKLPDGPPTVSTDESGKRKSGQAKKSAKKAPAAKRPAAAKKTDLAKGEAATAKAKPAAKPVAAPKAPAKSAAKPSARKTVKATKSTAAGKTTARKTAAPKKTGDA